MTKSAIIVAGGTGSRMKADLPKQFHLLKDIPVIVRTVQAFLNYSRDIDFIIVIHPKYVDYWKGLVKEFLPDLKYKIAEGGAERFESVQNGLSLVKPNSVVAIHDSVRPLVSQKTISNCFEMAIKTGTAVPCIDVAESVRIVEHNASKPIDRNRVKIVQTPQVFTAKILAEAYKQKYSPEFTDDATVVESAGYKVTLVEGNCENIKLTTPYDFLIAENLLGNLPMNH